VPERSIGHRADCEHDSQNQESLGRRRPPREASHDGATVQALAPRFERAWPLAPPPPRRTGNARSEVGPRRPARSCRSRMKPEASGYEASGQAVAEPFELL